MLASIAKFISRIFHPLLMPLYSVFFLFSFPSYLTFSISSPVQRFTYILVFISTFALPVITALFLLRRKQIESLEMNSSAERHLPFISSAIYYFTGYFLIQKAPLPDFFSKLMLGAAASIIIAGIINTSWKVSIHMIGAGGFTGMLFGLSRIIYSDMTIPIIIAFFIAGIIGSARLILNAHSPSQIYAGFAIGFIIMRAVLIISEITAA